MAMACFRQTKYESKSVLSHCCDGGDRSPFSRLVVVVDCCFEAVQYECFLAGGRSVGCVGVIGPFQSTA